MHCVLNGLNTRLPVGLISGQFFLANNYAACVAGRGGRGGRHTHSL